MNKVIIFLIFIVGLSATGAAVLMPEIPNFIMQKVLIIEGRAEIGTAVVDGTFTCDCVDMAGNVADCVFADFCASCTATGVQCDQLPNVPGPYFNSAAMCNVVTICP